MMTAKAVRVAMLIEKADRILHSMYEDVEAIRIECLASKPTHKDPAVKAKLWRVRERLQDNMSRLSTLLRPTRAHDSLLLPTAVFPLVEAIEDSAPLKKIERLATLAQIDLQKSHLKILSTLAWQVYSSSPPPSPKEGRP